MSDFPDWATALREPRARLHGLRRMLADTPSDAVRMTRDLACAATRGAGPLRLMVLQWGNTLVAWNHVEQLRGPTSERAGR